MVFVNRKANMHRKIRFIMRCRVWNAIIGIVVITVTDEHVNVALM